MLRPTVTSLGPLPSAHPTAAGLTAAAAPAAPIAECVERSRFEQPPAARVAATAA